MKKIILLVLLGVATLGQAAEYQYFSLIGENKGVNFTTTSQTVTNGTVGYSYRNVLSNNVVAGQYGYTNVFTNGSTYLTNFGPYQAGAFQDVGGGSVPGFGGFALSTGEPNNGTTFSSTLSGTDAGSTNTYTFVVQKSPDGVNWAVAGSAPTFTWAHVAMGTTNTTLVTNPPAAFIQGGVKFRILTIASGAAGATNTVTEVGLTTAVR